MSALSSKSLVSSSSLQGRYVCSLNGFRGCRMPAWLFFSLLIVACSAACVLIAFLPIYFPMQSSAKKSVVDFTDAVASVTLERLQRRFDTFRALGKLAQRVLRETPAFTRLDDPSTVDPMLPIDDTLRWFARSIYPVDMTLVLFHGVVDGFIMKSYSSLDGYHFPKRPGMISLANLSSASLTSFVDVGYFYLDTFAPVNTSHPFYRNTTLRYNISSRPWIHAMQQGPRLQWAPIFVSFAESTSAIALGASWGNFDGGNTAAEGRSVFSFHGNAKDVVTFFQTMSIGKTGAVLLVDVASRGFIGGNIADASIKTNATTGRPRLVLLEELEDPRVGPVIDAAATLGAGGRSLLLTSSCGWAIDATSGLNVSAPCVYAYHFDTGVLEPIADFDFSLISSRVSLVHVSRVDDDYGLDMRLILVIPTDDFVGEMRRGAANSVIVTVTVVAAVVLVTSVVVHFWLMAPLGHMAGVLRRVVDMNEVNEYSSEWPDASGRSTSSSMSQSATNDTTVRIMKRPRQVRRGSVEEINPHGISELSTIKRGIVKLLAALDVVTLFLPAPSSSTDRLTVDSLHQQHSMRSEATFNHSAIEGGADSTVTLMSPPMTPQVAEKPGGAVLLLPGSVFEKTAGVGSENLPQKVAVTKPFSSQSLYTVVATTVVANFVDFEAVRHTTKQLPSTFVAVHTAYLQVVLDACRAHGGTIDMFYGDRVWAHFNAEKRLPGHALKACKAMLAIEECVATNERLHELGSCDHPVDNSSESGKAAGCDSKFRLRVRLGAATSESVCGVMGSAAVKRFTIVGQCVRHAALLCASAGATRLRLRQPAVVEPAAAVTNSGDDSGEGSHHSSRTALYSRASTAPSAYAFSSLVSTKTAELANLRNMAAATRAANVVSIDPSKRDRTLNVRDSIVFRHVRISALIPNALTLKDQSVVSTPVWLSRVLLEYPAHIVSNDSEALKRMKHVNLLYEHAVAGDIESANRLVATLPFWEDEWLLRQLKARSTT